MPAPLTHVPPVAVILSLTGLAVWAEGLYFLGIGAKPRTGLGVPPQPAGAAAVPKPLSDPLRAVGMIMFIAGLSDLVQTVYVISSKPLGTPDTVILAGMLAIPSGWFTYLGISQVLELDMRPVGNVAVAVALVPLFWWNFFSDSRMIQSDLIVWGLAFLAATAHSYGFLPNRVFGGWLVLVSLYAFFLQPVLWALGHPLP
jgi:hypothetical protein